MSRQLGAGSRMIGDLLVSSIGLGAMEFSTDGRPDRRQAIAAVQAAVESGITLIDTADAYCLGPWELHHNEILVAEALRACGDAAAGVVVATKGGHTRSAGSGWDVDGRPEYLRRACDASLEALGVECIGLYVHHRPDPKVPYESTVLALKELREAGKISLIGISNVSVAQIEIAVQILGAGGLAAVENEFSPRARSGLPELRLCASLGVAYLPYSPLGGMGNGHQLAMLHPAFAEVAAARGVSAQQVALAWELSLGPHVIPIPGCSRPQTARDCAAAMHLTLDDAELDALSAASSLKPEPA